MAHHVMAGPHGLRLHFEVAGEQTYFTHPVTRERTAWWDGQATIEIGELKDGTIYSRDDIAGIYGYRLVRDAEARAFADWARKYPIRVSQDPTTRPIRRRPDFLQAA